MPCLSLKLLVKASYPASSVVFTITEHDLQRCHSFHGIKHSCCLLCSLCVHAFGHWCCDFLICASSRQWERENSILLSKSSKICRDSDQWSDENLDLRELERKYLSQTPLKGDTVPHKGCTSTGITQLTIAKNVYHKLPTTFRSQRIPSYISQWRRKTQYQSYQRFGWTNCAYQL